MKAFAAIAVAVCLTLPGSAVASRELKGALGTCATPPCHQATGEANYNAAWNKNYANAQAEGMEPSDAPVGYFSGTLSEAQMTCVSACQQNQQTMAAQKQPFDWKTCQANCGLTA